MVTSWDKTSSRIKAQFMPVDYEVQSYKKMQNLKQRDLDAVSTYTKKFQRPGLNAKHHEDEAKKVASYLNGLKYRFQDEISILAPDTVNKCFPMET